MSQSPRDPSNGDRVPTVQLSTESVIAAYISELSDGSREERAPEPHGTKDD
jgi:hypothetical protein